MLKEFEKFRGFTALEFFLRHPEEEASIRGLAKKTGMSTMSAKYYCDLLEEGGLLESESKGLAKFFRLRGKSPLARQWKRAYALQKLNECGMLEAFGENPFYVYGSIAEGEYTNQSDVDIFLIELHAIDEEKVRRFKEKAPWEVSILRVPFHELREYAKKHRALVEQIKGNGILFGDEIHGL